MRALDRVERESGEKFVMLYLSPGTPVMAFVWALAALSYPELKKRLIASSVVGMAPEVVSLPAEWLKQHGAKQDAIRDISNGFDVTFHLLVSNGCLPCSVFGNLSRRITFSLTQKTIPLHVCERLLVPEIYTNFLLTLGMIEPFMSELLNLRNNFQKKHESESI